MTIIPIDSVDDIDTALDLIEKESAIGGLIMPLKPEQRFEAWGVTITHAYCGASVALNPKRWICHALNEEESYRAPIDSPVAGALIHANKDRDVVSAALKRWFGREDFSDQQPDPYNNTVVPRRDE